MLLETLEIDWQKFTRLPTSVKLVICMIMVLILAAGIVIGAYVLS